MAFAVVGIWVLAAPSSVPGLTQPGSARAMQAMRAMDMHGTNHGMSMQPTRGTIMRKSTPSKKK